MAPAMLSSPAIPALVCRPLRALFRRLSVDSTMLSFHKSPIPQLSGGKSLTTQTSASGNYSFPNLPAGRNYTVTPSKPSFGFVPTSSSFTSVLVNQTANFIAQATVQFNVGSYVANEADGKATVTI